MGDWLTTFKNCFSSPTNEQSDRNQAQPQTGNSFRGRAVQAGAGGTAPSRVDGDSPTRESDASITGAPLADRRVRPGNPSPVSLRSSSPSVSVEQSSPAGSPLSASRPHDAMRPSVWDPIPYNGEGAAELQRELDQEKDKAVDNGYAREVFDVGNPVCTYPSSIKGFRDIVVGFNLAMADLHERFPALKDLEPPCLSRKDPSVAAQDPELHANYDEDQHALAFKEVDDFGDWDRICDEDGTFMGAPGRGFASLVAHEYGHHLSCRAVVPEENWRVPMEMMLRMNGSFGKTSGRSLVLPYSTAFSIRTGKLVRDLGIGYYAGTHHDEFAAEAIAWRLHPQYGASADAPRMPRVLEDWVHRHFEFLDNGDIPEPSVEFDPGAVKVPIWRNGQVDWISKHEWSAILARRGQ